MSQHAITISNFSKSFGRLKVIHDLSFKVKKGEIFAFLGANGSGKTTTIRNLLGIQQPDTGSLLINGEKYETSKSHLLGYLPEERGLYTGSQVLETLEHFGKLKGLSSSEAKTAALKYLEQVELADKATTEIKKLSSGQQQKIQLGITLINNPELLILDEPWKGLDPVNRGLLAKTLTEMNKQGTTILFSTHQMEDAEKLAHSLLLLKQGRAALYGDLDEVKRQFGEDTIHLDFSGKLESETDLYNAKVDTNYAEIVPKENVTTDDILKYLAAGAVKVRKFEVTTPSLQEIFIKVSSQDE